MSPMQKALKALCWLALIAGVDLAITLVVLLTGGGALAPLQLVLMVLTAFFSCFLFAVGIRAAVVPELAVRMLPIVVLALLVNAADVALAIQSGTAVVSICVNALVAVGIACTVHALRRAGRR